MRCRARARQALERGLPGLGSVGRGMVLSVPRRPEMTIEATSPSRQVRGQAGTPAPTVKAEPTKSAIVVKLLSRTKGATLSEVAKATGWQPHSCRAFLTGLRKRGRCWSRSSEKMEQLPIGSPLLTL